MNWLLVIAGAMVGAPARYLTDRTVQTRHDSVFPWGTLTVNTVGCAILGLLTGAVTEGAASPHLQLADRHRAVRRLDDVLDLLLRDAAARRGRSALLRRGQCRGESRGGPGRRVHGLGGRPGDLGLNRPQADDPRAARRITVPAPPVPAPPGPPPRLPWTDGGGRRRTREAAMRDAGIRDAAMPDADPGLFGPGSVTWQLHGDPVMWVAGVRALYLQALHPRAVRGVVQNSDFRRDAWGRLLRTASFVGEITYGTAPAAERALRPDTRYPPQALRDRPGHGGAVRRRRPRTPAVGALRRDRLVSARRPPLRLPAHRRARRRLRRRAARGRPAGRSRPRRRARRHRRAGPLLRPGPPAPCRDPRGVRGGPLPRRAARAVVPGAAAARRVAGGQPAPPSRPCRRTPRSCTAARCPPRPRPTMRLRAAGRLLRAVPATLRWQLPPGHILKAVARLGPGARPSAGRLRPPT